MRTVLIFLLAISSVAHADDARDHYARGAVLYEATRYEAALREFETAQATDPRPALVYNIARCLERLNRRGEAAAAYERYLRETPDADNIADVQVRMAALLLPAEVVRPILEVTPRTKPHRYLIPGIVGGGALALAAVGAGLLGSAAAEYRSLDSSCSPTCSTGSWANLPAREHAGEAVLGVAGAAVVVDVVLFVIAAKKGRK